MKSVYFISVSQVFRVDEVHVSQLFYMYKLSFFHFYFLEGIVFKPLIHHMDNLDSFIDMYNFFDQYIKLVPIDYPKIYLGLKNCNKDFKN